MRGLQIKNILGQTNNVFLYFTDFSQGQIKNKMQEVPSTSKKREVLCCYLAFLFRKATFLKIRHILIGNVCLAQLLVSSLDSVILFSIAMAKKPKVCFAFSTLETGGEWKRIAPSPVSKYMSVVENSFSDCSSDCVNFEIPQ